MFVKLYFFLFFSCLHSISLSCLARKTKHPLSKWNYIEYFKLVNTRKMYQMNANMVKNKYLRTKAKIV